MGLTRRRFLATAGLGLAGPWVLAGRALGGEANPPPSDRVVIGIIGVGGQGSSHLSLRGNPRARIAAVCDVYQPNLLRAKQAVDDCDAYDDFRRIIDRKDVDAVVVATPDHWHALITIMACQSGKDVYCEKPLSLTVPEGRAMVNAARRYGRVVQMGTQHRSNPRIRQVCEWVRSGRIGKVDKVRVWMTRNATHPLIPDSEPPPDLNWDMWLGPSPWVPYHPQRCPYNFRWFFAYAGGYMTDWGVHMLSVVSWGMGSDATGPVSIEATGRADPNSLYDVPVEMSARFEFAEPAYVMTWQQPGTGDEEPGHEYGMQFCGSQGTITDFFGGHVVHPNGLDLGPTRAGEVHLYQSNSHHDNWLDCIASRQRPIVDVEIGHRITSMCALGNLAYRLGRKLRWDPVQEQFIGDDAANRVLGNPYRAPWRL